MTLEVATFLFAASFMAVGQARVTGAASPTPIFFIGERETGRWCAFGSKAQLLQEENRIHASAKNLIPDYEMGEANPNGKNALARLTIIVFAQSGDWAVTDHYRLRGASPTLLRREIGYADGSGPVVRTYVRQQRRWALRSSSGSAAFVPDIVRYRDMTNAPFYRFVLQAARRPTLPENGLCSTSQVKAR